MFAAFCRASALAAMLVAAPLVRAQVAVDPAFLGPYTASNLGPTGVPMPYGGLGFGPGPGGNLYIGTGANTAGGSIWTVTIVRTGSGQITGFSSPTCISGAAYNDGALSFSFGFPQLLFASSSDPALTPSGVLQVDPVMPGLMCSTPAGQTNVLSVPFPISGLGWLAVLPLTSFRFKVVANDPAGTNPAWWYDLPFAGPPCCTGYYTFPNVAPNASVQLMPGSGSKGFAYGGGCSPVFIPQTTQRLFVCESTLGDIAVYEADQFGDPVPGTRQIFATFPGVIGAVFDPVTADLLTTDGTDLWDISGFVVPTGCPCEFNHDGQLSSADFFDFLNAYFAGQPIANINCDGVLNSQDFFDFLNCFFSGC